MKHIFEELLATVTSFDLEDISEWIPCNLTQ